jgi:hypothetical protein
MYSDCPLGISPSHGKSGRNVAVAQPPRPLPRHPAVASGMILLNKCVRPHVVALKFYPPLARVTAAECQTRLTQFGGGAIHAGGQGAPIESACMIGVDRKNPLSRSRAGHCQGPASRLSPHEIVGSERSSCNSRHHSPDHRPWSRSSLSQTPAKGCPALETCSSAPQ